MEDPAVTLHLCRSLLSTNSSMSHEQNSYLMSGVARCAPEADHQLQAIWKKPCLCTVKPQHNTSLMANGISREMGFKSRCLILPPRPMQMHPFNFPAQRIFIQCEEHSYLRPGSKATDHVPHVGTRKLWKKVTHICTTELVKIKINMNCGCCFSYILGTTYFLWDGGSYQCIPIHD